MLDVEVVGAIAPGAEQLVYFAPASDRGFLDAVTTALFDPRGPSILSISWGQAEDEWTEQGAACARPGVPGRGPLGITVCAASGDNGWRDGVTGRVRARRLSRPRAHTSSRAGARASRRRTTGIDEVVWNDHDGNSTGGGVSDALRRAVVAGGVRGFHASVNEGAGAGRGVPGRRGERRSRTPATWWATA